MGKNTENPKQDPFVFGAFMNDNLKFHIKQLKALQSYKQLEGSPSDTAQRVWSWDVSLRFLGEDPKGHF